MPRLSTSCWYLARPTRLMTPSLRPPSRWSWTSISMSRPDTSWNAPSTSLASLPGENAPLGALPATTAGDRNRLTWKLKERARKTLATAALHPQSAVAFAVDAQDDELQRLCRGHPDLD